jgi:hypothetical protein
MTLDSWLHFGHVLSAIVWVGGGLMLSIVGLRVRASGDPNAIRQFAGTLSYAGIRSLTPGGGGDARLWRLAGPRERRMGLRAALGPPRARSVRRRLPNRGRLPQPDRTRLQRLAVSDEPMAANDGSTLLDRWLVGYGTVLVVLLIAVWDMVFKPGL